MIGGTGRCGTTILRDIFRNHPDVATVPEWRFMVDPDGLLDFYSTFLACWSPYLYDVKLKRLESLLRKIGRNNYIGAVSSYSQKKIGLRQKLPYRLAGAYSEVLYVKKYCPDYSMLVKELINDLNEFSYKGQWFGKKFLWKNEFKYGSTGKNRDIAKKIGKFYYKVIASVLNARDKKYYLEKNTWNILWFDKILDIIPESKLIHIYRDPRDVVSSFLKQPWSPSEPVQAAIYYKDIIEYWWNIRKNLPLESYYEISLESLVSNKEKVLRELCLFMKIEWSDTLMATDLSRSHSGRWEKKLTFEQQREVNSILHNHISKLGY